MQISWLRALIKYPAPAILAVWVLAGTSFGQERAYIALEPEGVGAAPAIIAPAPQPTEVEKHRFWDRENTLLFGAVAASATADFVVTHSNLENGGRELNPITRVFAGSTAGLAVNFAGETAGVIGLSYFFHKTGHHKLERAVSFVNAGSSLGAVTYGLTHR